MFCPVLFLAFFFENYIPSLKNFVYDKELTKGCINVLWGITWDIMSSGPLTRSSSEPST